MLSLFGEEDVDIPEWMLHLQGKVEIESILQLCWNDKKYRDMLDRHTKLQKQYPIIETLQKGYSAITLSEAEHEAYHEYLHLRSKIECREKQQIYLCGCAHCYECMKKIGVSWEK